MAGLTAQRDHCVQGFLDDFKFLLGVGGVLTSPLRLLTAERIHSARIGANQHPAVDQCDGLAGIEEIVIKDVQLAYYSKSASEIQQYLQPVYFFTGIMRGGKKTKRPFEQPYEQYIIAIEKPMEALLDMGIEHKIIPRRELKIPTDKDEDVKGS